MEIHHCENPVCQFVTRHAVPDMCPLCGGAFFLPSDGSDLVAANWVALGIESKTDGRFDDAFSDFEKAAAEGDAAGQCMLGLAYETGEGVAQSWPDAVLLYRAAAGQGHAQAQCNLGWCYEFGKGVPQDAKAAARWYGEAALQHDPGPSAAWPSATPTAPAWQRTPCAPCSCIPYPPRRGLCPPCATLHRWSI